MAISKFKADLGLLSVTVFWGSTFIISKLILKDVPLPVFLFLRLTIAAIIIMLFAVKYFRMINLKLLLHGSVLGVFLYLSYFFQMWGIQFTSASNAAFITALSVVLVPIAGFLFFSQKPSLNVIAGIIFATVGLLFLTGANPFQWNHGDLLVLLCAVTVAFHIIYTGRFAPAHNIYLLTAVQLAVVSLFTVFSLILSPVTWPELDGLSVAGILYLASFGTVYAYLMQTSMQRYTTTARTALIFSMEPVFGALFAFIIANERLTAVDWLGGLLIVAGMIIAEIPWQNVQQFKRTFLTRFREES